MKVIKSYIDDNGFDAGSRMDILSEQLLNYFSEIPSDFEKEPYRDYILENLNTHDKSLLQAQLTKYFGITEFHDLSSKPNENTSFWFKSFPHFGHIIAFTLNKLFINKISRYSDNS